ncbi:MAG: cysteine--tRNA ligase, partial [Desulfamplus sp.]|nr:cysteine--tRNA ligase [Desulfamplus sp.]
MSSGAAMAAAIREALNIKKNLTQTSADEKSSSIKGDAISTIKGNAVSTIKGDAISTIKGNAVFTIKGDSVPTIVVILPDSGERYLSTSLFTVADNIKLNVFNTIERKIVRFEPIAPGKVSIYTCGPTVYKPLDPGNFRRFVCADLLCRYLEYRKLAVNHVVNITDMDDKTIQGSEKTGESLAEFTDRYIKLFKHDLNLLKIREAQAYPKVSDHLDSMVNLASKLVEKGFAYEKLNSLYFNLSALSGYGELSGVDLDKILVGATVDLDNYEKDHPRDFTLIKR